MAAALRTTLVEGDITRSLLRLALPMGLGIVFILAVNLIDTYFIGQLGTDELAAISFSFPVVSLIASITMGFGVGATSAIARAIGSGDEQRVRRLATHALIFAISFVALLSLLGLATQRALFGLLGAEGHLLELLLEYMTIWFIGVVFLVVPMIGSGAMRATGDTRTPMFIMMAAAIANAILDPIMIFGLGPVPAMGLRGAAIATLISRAITLVVTLWFLIRKLDLLDLHWPSGRELLSSWRSILSVGIPAALTNALAPVATGVMTALIAAHGTAAVAAWGVGSRLEGMILIAPLALSSALTPFIGQNWGAHRQDRVAGAVRRSRGFVLLWGAGAWIVMVLAGGSIGGVFTDDAEVVEKLQLFFWIVPIGYGAHAVVSVISATYNAIDKAVRSTVLSATRSLLLAIPLAALGSWLFELTGLFAGVALATILTGLIANFTGRALMNAKPASTKLPAPQADEDVPSAASSMIGAAQPDCELADILVTRVRALPNMRVTYSSGKNALEFFHGERELGHLHRRGKLDLLLPPTVCDQLVADARAEHHRHHHDTAWVTHLVLDREDLDEAFALIELAHALSRLAAHVRGDHDDELSKLAELEDALAGLQASDELRARVCELLDHWHALAA